MTRFVQGGTSKSSKSPYMKRTAKEAAPARRFKEQRVQLKAESTSKKQKKRIVKRTLEDGRSLTTLFFREGQQKKTAL